MAGRPTKAESERRRLAREAEFAKERGEQSDISDSSETTNVVNEPTGEKKAFTIGELEQNIDNATLGVSNSKPKAEGNDINSPDFGNDKDDPDYVPKETVNPFEEQLIENESDANTAAKKVNTSSGGNNIPPKTFAPPIIDGAAPTVEEQPQQHQQKKPEPLNPDFDKMSASDKQKAVEMFADAIIGNYAELLPIIPKMIAKYDMEKMQLLDDEGNIRLSMVVDRDENGDLTIKEHCINFNNTCDKTFVVTDEMKSELRGPLIAFLMEKGVAPSPLTTLLITVGKHTLTFVIAAIQMRGERNAALKTFTKFRKQELEGEKEQHKSSQFKEPEPTTNKKEQAAKSEKKVNDLKIEDIVDVEEIKNPKTEIKSNNGGINMDDIVIEEEN